MLDDAIETVKVLRIQTRIISTPEIQINVDSNGSTTLSTNFKSTARLLLLSGNFRGLVLPYHTDSYNQKIHPIKTGGLGVILLD
ncbi:MAG: hypothetical protein V3U87_08145 [Methylococcaceae bacterium]